MYAFFVSRYGEGYLCLCIQRLVIFRNFAKSSSNYEKCIFISFLQGGLGRKCISCFTKVPKMALGEGLCLGHGRKGSHAGKRRCCNWWRHFVFCCFRCGGGWVVLPVELTAAVVLLVFGACLWVQSLRMQASVRAPTGAVGMPTPQALPARHFSPSWAR